MKNTIQMLETLSRLLDKNRDMLATLPDDTSLLIRDAIDRAVDHLKKEFPEETRPNPFDLDDKEQRVRGIITQVDTMTDAMQKLKRRFDKLVVKECAPELNDLIRDMCMLSAHTTDLARLIVR